MASSADERRLLLLAHTLLAEGRCLVLVQPGLAFSVLGALPLGPVAASPFAPLQPLNALVVADDTAPDVPATLPLAPGGRCVVVPPPLAQQLFPPPLLKAPDADLSLETQLALAERAVMPHRITRRLLLGDYASVTNLGVLRHLRVCAVVNASNRFGNCFPRDFAYLSVDVDDYDCIDLLGAHFERVARFYQRHVLEADAADAALVVHCAAGMSRSAALAAALLVRFHRVSVRQALTILRSRRSMVSPNRGFLAQLLNFENGKSGASDAFVRLEDLLLDDSDPTLLWKDGLVIAVRRDDGTIEEL